MNMLNEPLDIFFRKISPEELYRKLLAQEQGEWEPTFWARHILGRKGKDRFFRSSEKLQERYSPDEISYIQDLTRECAQRKAAEGELTEENVASVFYLLPNFTENILSVKWGEPLCDKRYVFQWREMSFRLGQDILTTAHCAYNDRETGGQTDFFAWPTAIHVNNPIVEEIMEKEVAENHFHLLGSIPPFHMTWVELMNHPEDIYRLDNDPWVKERFQRDMAPTLQYSPNERKMSYIELLQLAFWLRVHLFRRVCGLLPLSYKEESKSAEDQAKNLADRIRIPYNCLDEFECCKATRMIRFSHIAERMRRCYGTAFLQSDGSKKCLDYAFPEQLHNPKNENYYRILTGERYLLYRCFYECFSNGFDYYEQDIFYLYLLLKSWFRNELIQVNQKVGFRNFSDYQDRKDALWNHRSEYVAEGYRIAVNGNMEDQLIKTQENRITPSNEKRELRRKICKIDREIIFAADSYYKGTGYDFNSNKAKWIPPSIYENKEARNTKAFYTLHFPKNPDTFSEKGTNLIPPRNMQERSKSKTQAIALARALTEYPYLRYRIRGVDACSHEIGCRPETFATEFRFLRHFRSSSVVQDRKTDTAPWPRLCATYHAGEDFLDLIDGLRAIDEAVTFLELERGDRLGHALAMGLEPHDYYRFKDQYIVTTKQNRLDDLVWLLFRSIELKVSIPPDLYRQLENEAYSLLDEIYGRNIPETKWCEWNLSLQDYFYSWKLRGDHPDFFTRQKRKESKGYQEKEKLGGYYSLESQYFLFEERQKGYISQKPGVRGVLHYYHYDRQVREKGREKLGIKSSLEWEIVLRAMQDAMISELTAKGIYIECNPTSNYLISTFSSYQDHPLFRFNEYWKGKQDGNQLCISLNTDDMGVFDTSIENEYALIAAAMEEMRDNQGKRIYSDDAIKKYLEQLRIMGHRQTFRPIQGGTYAQRRYRTNSQLADV